MLSACLLLLGFTLTAGVENETRKVIITDFAVPSSVKEGQNVELQCRYSLQEQESTLFMVKWWWKPLHSEDNKDDVMVYQRLKNSTGNASHKYFDVTVKENDTIELKNLQPKHSGTYACKVSNDAEVTRSQLLIVYTPGTGPKLNHTLLKDESGKEVVLMTCEANDAAPEPELTIYIDGKEIVASEKYVKDDTQSFWNISVATNATLTSDNQVRCELFFRDANVSHAQYYDSFIYKGAGSELFTAEAIDTTTEWQDGAATPSGSPVPNFSWFALLAVAALVQKLVPC